jgi:hypothetical protein
MPIDWKIQVGGEDLPGWDPDKDWCGFPDEEHQRFLYPYFNVGDQVLEWYDRTEFFASDMKRLRDRMEGLLYMVDHNPSVWTIKDSSQSRYATLNLDRYKIAALAVKTREMIDRALEIGGTLVFMGD